jgi:PmbA protein
MDDRNAFDTLAAAERALARMRHHGFEHAQVGASATALAELNIAHDEPSLMRSTEQCKLSLLGIVDGRKAAAELTTLDDAAVDERIASLLAQARSAPRDEANAVSSDQRTDIVQGPLVPDEALLADKVAEILGFRARETPKMTIDESFVAHTAVRSHVLTSGGSQLACRLGWYAVSVFGTAREGQRSSSFAYTGGSSHDLSAAHAVRHFGIEELLRDTERQIDTQPIPAKFVGDVVLAPAAVEDLVQWLQGQVGDVQLIAGSSLYRDRVGERIASPLLTLKSRFDAPGMAAFSPDAFVTPPVHLLRAGVLETLTPSLYGSRKTGLKHVPVAAGGWEIEAGDTPRAQVVGGVARGALVGRLSMGMPAANGDFSGVVKNSFLIEGGQVGPALSETMIAGNIARMLQEVAAVSRERIDYGALRLPWIRIAGLHFS